MANGKKTYTQIGTMLKNDKGAFIVLGSNRGNDKYDYNVEIRVTLADGTRKLFKNGIVSLQDPRKRKGADPEKVPASVLNNLVIVSEE